MIHSPDGREGPRIRGYKRDFGLFDPGPARGRARPLPGAQERAGAGAARRPRPRDRNAPEPDPRAPGGKVEARRQALERAELDRRLREERVDVTLPGDERRSDRSIHDPHPPARRGRVPRARVRDRRRPRGRDSPLQLRPARLPAGAPDALAAQHLLHRPRAPAPHRDLAVADPHDGGKGAAHLHGLDRPRLPARRDQPRRASRSSTSSRASPSTAGSRSPT